jgi:hypothetical protein
MKRLKFSALLVLGLSILFYFFFDFCKHAPVLGASNPYAEDPYDAVGSFGIFLAFVSAVLTMLRAFRPTQQNKPADGQIVLYLRAETVALLSVVVTLAADAIGLGRAVVTKGSFPAAIPLAGILGGMTFVTLGAAWIFLRAARSMEILPVRRSWWRAGIISGLVILILAFYPLQWRESGVPGGVFTALVGMSVLFVTTWGLATAIFPMNEFEYEDVFDDVTAFFQRGEKRISGFAGPINQAGKPAAFPPMRGLLGWLNPRRHQWNLVILAAAAMGLMVVSVESLAEGMPTNLGRALLVVGVYVCIGGAGVVLGYVLFGKYLGIFRVE